MIEPPGPPTPPPFPAWRTALGVLTLALTIVTGLLFTALWNSGWFVQVPREFEPAGLDCVVEMPGVVHESVLFPVGEESCGPEYAVRRRFPWESFGLAARELPADGDGRDLLTPMDAYLRDFFKTLPGAPDPVAQTVRDEKYPIRQAAATTPKYGTVVARVIYGGPKLYLLVAAGKAVTQTRPDVTRFFDSFRCTDAEDLTAAANALTEFVAAGFQRDPSAPPFEARPYGGPVVPAAADFPGLTHHWACDAADASWFDFVGNCVGSWSRPGPARVPGVRDGAIAFGSSRRHVAEWDEPTDFFPGDSSTLTFWYRSTPGVGRLLDFAPAADGTDVVELNDGSVLMKLRVLPEKVTLTLPGGRDRQARDGDWHHVAVVRRRGATGPRTEVWLDGVLTHEAVTPAGEGAEATSRLAVGGAATLVRDRILPPATGFRAALDELCVYSRALDETEIRRLAAAPEPPYWLQPGTGLPKPLAYLAWEATAARTGRLPDAVGGRVYQVNGPVKDVDAPAGRGYAITPTSPNPAVTLGPWRFALPQGQDAVKADEVSPFTAAVWASHDGETPLILLHLGALRLMLTRGVASVSVKPDSPPVFVADNLAAGWHHYTLTRSRAGVVQFYVDGVAVTGRVEVSGTNDRSPSSITLGRFPTGAVAETFKLSEFVLLSDVTTAKQVRRIASVKLVD